MKLVTLTQETKKDLLNHLLKRSPNNYGAFEERVQAIIQEVRAKGDEALFAYPKQFDKVELTAETIRVTPEEIEEAYREWSRLFWMSSANHLSTFAAIMRSRSSTAGLIRPWREQCLARR